jgi:hypothetical protein
MSVDADNATLKAEVLALQAVMIGVFRRMVTDRPELAASFCQAFDDAETILSGVAVKMGIDAPAETTIGALQVVEEIRAAVIPDEIICHRNEGSAYAA